MTQKNIWNVSVKELMEKYQVTEQGLTTARAEELRLEKGENILQESRRKSIPEVFISQFADLLVVILIIAAAISMFSGNTESTIVILLVLVINAILGTLQHVKAQRSLDSLRQLSSPGAKVIRDGVKQELPSKDIVPGDIVILEAGDMIVADGRILHSYSLQVNESSLTGESANVEKTDAIIEGDVALADRANMVYSGSMVTYGRAEMLVTATGMETELGKIAGLMNAAKERKTPLQESLDKFSSRLAILIMIICAVVFCLCIYRRMTLLDSMMFAVALAVAAIPEALSSIVTIVQAFGTQKMAKENAIIKNLKAVESLGCVSVICSDKTGTLTQNKMTVQQIYIEDRLYEPDQLDLLNQTHRYLLYDAVLNNDSSIVDDKGIGDPTEYALLEMFRRIEADTSSILKEANMHEDILRQNMQRLEEVPFDSDRKLMSTKYILHGVPTILTKGAVDVLLDRCDYVRCSDGIRPMTEAEKDKIRMKNQLFSENGLRVLSFAYKESEENLDIHAEYGYTFLGLISMVDPPREESAAAVAASKRAGIRPVMITGDHRDTAVAIGMELGILTDPSQAITGAELNQISDEDFAQRVTEFSVYARVQPEHKVRIVKAWKARGMVTAMTGDGVNDAPSIKIADIGVGMGITGTDVTKNVADMILSDDNFATIVKAAEEGRRIYDNIRRTIRFLLSSNLSEVISILIATLLGFTILKPTHLLWINLITDAFPALALGMEAGEKDIMQRPPRDRKEGIFAGGLGVDVVWQGFVIALLTLAAYLIGDYMERGHFAIENSADGMTMAFLTMSLTEMFHAFNMRRERGSIFAVHRQNWYLFGAMAFSLIATTAVIYIPALKQAFQFESISPAEYLTAVGLAFLIIPIVELVKLFRRLGSK